MTSKKRIPSKSLLFTLIACGVFTACSKTNTKLDSDDYATVADRISVLKKEIKAPTEFSDAEFELFNVNGFQNQRTLAPGASSWDYKFAVRIKKADIPAWTSGMKQTDLPNYDHSWTSEIVKRRKQNWNTKSDPEYFVREHANVTMLVYRNEGIIFKRVINL